MFTAGVRVFQGQAGWTADCVRLTTVQVRTTGVNRRFGLLTPLLRLVQSNCLAFELAQDRLWHSHRAGVTMLVVWYV